MLLYSNRTIFLGLSAYSGHGTHGVSLLDEMAQKSVLLGFRDVQGVQGNLNGNEYIIRSIYILIISRNEEQSSCLSIPIQNIVAFHSTISSITVRTSFTRSILKMVAYSMILPAALSILIPSASALGCYSGFTFDSLHGEKADLHQEVVNDINTACTIANGKVLQPGEVWTHCSEWASEKYNDCYETCEAGCDAMGSNPYCRGCPSGALCSLGCDPDCGGIEKGVNKIDWAIRNIGTSAQTITWDTCNRWFNLEKGGCQSGSEQHHDEFWYRIDPGMGACS
jgi:hypothetical protein